MEDKEFVEALNKSFDIMRNQDFENPQYTVFCNKAIFFAIQEKNYFVIGTRIIINPVFAYKKKYKKIKEQLWDSFDSIDLHNVPAFKTRNAAKRAVAYNRKHEWLTANHQKEAEHYGVKIVEVEPRAFEGEIHL